MANTSYEYTDLYYPDPIQVRYYWNGDWRRGIGWLTMIIDNKTGETVLIRDVIQQAGANNIHFDDAIVERGWIPLIPMDNLF